MAFASLICSLQDCKLMIDSSDIFCSNVQNEKQKSKTEVLHSWISSMLGA
uniref:Uncharacterized protein n=1 Tax=Arundo donax TaxID=35708 RepID=A0A0A9EFC0_ARUDO